MEQAILVAFIAGLAAAFLSGVMTPGSVPMMPRMLAPLPLFIAGFGWIRLSRRSAGFCADPH